LGERHFWESDWNRPVSEKIYLQVHGPFFFYSRVSKRVIIDDGQFLDYDVLYLFYGVQYEMPEKLLSKVVERPSNSIVINTKIDLEKTLGRMQKVIGTDPQTAKFIIYGLNMDSLSFLRYCLDTGIQGRCFAIVASPKDEFYEFDYFVSWISTQLATLT
jgi:hypothetical protein